LKAWLRQG